MGLLVRRRLSTVNSSARKAPVTGSLLLFFGVWNLDHFALFPPESKGQKRRKLFTVCKGGAPRYIQGFHRNSEVVFRRPEKKRSLQIIRRTPPYRPTIVSHKMFPVLSSASTFSFFRPTLHRKNAYSPSLSRVILDSGTERIGALQCRQFR